MVFSLVESDVNVAASAEYALDCLKMFSFTQGQYSLEPLKLDSIHVEF